MSEKGQLRTLDRVVVCDRNSPKSDVPEANAKASLALM